MEALAPHDDEATPQTFAHVYPWASWKGPSDARLKTLLLFFDGISALLPEAEWKRRELESELTATLLEQDRLLLLDPAAIVDADIAASLAARLLPLAQSGVFDALRRELRENITYVTDDGVPLLRDKFGSHVDAPLSDPLIAELVRAGLAGFDQDASWFVKMPGPLADYVLCLLGQFVPPRVSTLERVHEPTAADDALPEFFRSRVGLADVAMIDLMTIGANVADTPLYEILDFRRQYASELRAYLDDAAVFAAAVSDSKERREVAARLRERASRISQAAADLTAARHRRVRASVGVTLGLAGATWTAATGDPIGAVLGAAAIVASTGYDRLPVTNVSYVVRAARLA